MCQTGSTRHSCSSSLSPAARSAWSRPICFPTLPTTKTDVGVPDAAGVDLFIGEPDLIGMGLGKAIVRRFVADIGWRAFPETKRYMAGPSAKNLRSRRTFEAAGFVFVRQVDVAGEPDPEAIMVLERRSIP